MPLEDRDGVLEESLEGSMELLLRWPGPIRLMETDFLTADFSLGCVVTVFGRCYHVVSSASRPNDVLLSTWSRPEVDLIKVEGMEGM